MSGGTAERLFGTFAASVRTFCSRRQDPISPLLAGRECGSATWRGCPRCILIPCYRCRRRSCRSGHAPLCSVGARLPMHWLLRPSSWGRFAARAYGRRGAACRCRRRVPCGLGLGGLAPRCARVNARLGQHPAAPSPGREPERLAAEFGSSVVRERRDVLALGVSRSAFGVSNAWGRPADNHITCCYRKS